MRRMFPWMVMGLALAVAGPGMGAEKKDKDKESTAEKRERLRENWPADREVDRAIGKARYKSDDTATIKFRGKTMRFVPADLGGQSDEQRADGIILGKLDLDGESKGGLAPGQYPVFVRKSGSKWEAYFFHKGAVVAKSADVQKMDDKAGNPMFKQAGAAVYYWILQIEY